MKYLHKMKGGFTYRFLVGIVLFTFVLATPGISYAQALNLPAPGTMLGMSPAFAPPLIKGLMINPDNPLQFDFLIDPGNADFRGKSQSEKAEEYRKLVKYFLASLTVPEEDLWVNLSPYEKDRIIADGFGKTEMGRDLLSQDYILKQLAASLMYPEKELGKKFWAKVYKEAQEKFGTIDIPVNTFNKVWIIPDSASVYEKDNTVFLVESHLKVMLEEDYVALDHNSLSKELGTNQLVKKEVQDVSSLSSKIVREVIIPAIEKEVNEGKNFALLRQINNSLILATWYKTALKESLLGKVYVNRSKTEGITQEDIEDNQKIYAQYLEAFKKGVYNFIKEEYDPVSEETIPRKYFSGGYSTIDRSNPNRAMLAQRINRSGDPAMLARAGQVIGAERVEVVLEEPAEQANRAMMGSTGQEPIQADLRDLVVDALKEMSTDTNALGNALRASVRRSRGFDLKQNEEDAFVGAIAKWIQTQPAQNKLDGVKISTTVRGVLNMIVAGSFRAKKKREVFRRKIDVGKFALELQKYEIKRKLTEAEAELVRREAISNKAEMLDPGGRSQERRDADFRTNIQAMKEARLQEWSRHIFLGPPRDRDRAMMGGAKVDWLIKKTKSFDLSDVTWDQLSQSELASAQSRLDEFSTDFIAALKKFKRTDGKFGLIDEAFARAWAARIKAFDDSFDPAVSEEPVREMRIGLREMRWQLAEVWVEPLVAALAKKVDLLLTGAGSISGAVQRTSDELTRFKKYPLSEMGYDRHRDFLLTVVSRSIGSSATAQEQGLKTEIAGYLAELRTALKGFSVFDRAMMGGADVDRLITKTKGLNLDGLEDYQQNQAKVTAAKTSLTEFSAAFIAVLRTLKTEDGKSRAIDEKSAREWSEKIKALDGSFVPVEESFPVIEVRRELRNLRWQLAEVWVEPLVVAQLKEVNALLSRDMENDTLMTANQELTRFRSVSLDGGGYSLHLEALLNISRSIGSFGTATEQQLKTGITKYLVKLRTALQDLPASDRAMMGSTSTGQSVSALTQRNLVVDALRRMSFDKKSLRAALAASLLPSAEKAYDKDAVKDLARRIKKGIEGVGLPALDQAATVDKVLEISGVASLAQHKFDLGLFVGKLMRYSAVDRLKDAKDRLELVEHQLATRHPNRGEPKKSKIREDIEKQQAAVEKARDLKDRVFNFISTFDRAMTSAALTDKVSTILRGFATTSTPREKRRIVGNLAGIAASASFSQNDKQWSLGIQEGIRQLAQLEKGWMSNAKAYDPLKASITASAEIVALERRISAAIETSGSTWAKIRNLTMLAGYYVKLYEQYSAKELEAGRSADRRPLTKESYYSQRYEKVEGQLTAMLESFNADEISRQASFISYFGGTAMARELKANNTFSSMRRALAALQKVAEEETKGDYSQEGVDAISKISTLQDKMKQLIAAEKSLSENAIPAIAALGSTEENLRAEITRLEAEIGKSIDGLKPFWAQILGNVILAGHYLEFYEKFVGGEDGSSDVEDNSYKYTAVRDRLIAMLGVRPNGVLSGADRAMLGGGVGTDVALGGEYTVEKLRELFTRISDQGISSVEANALNLFPILTRLNETLTSLKSNNEDLPPGSIRLTLENLMEAVRQVVVEDSREVYSSSSIIKDLSEAEKQYHDSPRIQRGDSFETIRTLEGVIDATVNESESSWTKIYVLSRLAIHYIEKAESYGRITGARDVFDNPIEPKVRYFQDRYEATKEKLIEVLKSMLVLKEDAFVNYRVSIDEKTSGNIHFHLWQKGFIDVEGLVTDKFYSGTTVGFLNLSDEYSVAIREWILKVLNVAVGRKPEDLSAPDQAMLAAKLTPVLEEIKQIDVSQHLSRAKGEVIRILTSLIGEEAGNFVDLFKLRTELLDVANTVATIYSSEDAENAKYFQKTDGRFRLAISTAQRAIDGMKVESSDLAAQLTPVLEKVKEIEIDAPEKHSFNTKKEEVINFLTSLIGEGKGDFGYISYWTRGLQDVELRLSFSPNTIGTPRPIITAIEKLDNAIREALKIIAVLKVEKSIVPPSDRAMIGSAEDFVEQVVSPLIFSGVLGGSETIYAGDTIFTSNKPIKIIDITRSSGGEWEISLASDIYDYQRGPDRLRIKAGSVNRAKDGEIVYKKDNGEDVGRLTKKGDNQWTWAAGGSIELAEDGTLKITKGSEVITAKKAGDHWEVGQFLAKKNSAGDWFIVKQKIPSIEDPESALHGALQMAYTYYLGLVEEGALREALELIDSGYGVIHDFKRSSFVGDPWDRNAEDTVIEKLLARIVEAIGRKKNSFKNSFERIEELNRILRERNLFEFVGSIPDNVKNEVEKLRGGEELSRLELIRVNRLLLEENFGVPVYKWLEEPESLKAMLDSPSQIGPFTGLNDDEVKQKLTIAGERIRAELDRRASNRMIDDYEDPLLTARERKNLIEMMLNTLATDASVRAWIPETIQRDEEDVAIDMLRVASLKREDYVVLDERQRSLIGRMNREMGAELAKNLKIVHMYGNREWEDKGYFVVEKGESTSDAVEVVGAIKDILERWLLLEEVKSINPSRLWDFSTVETKKILVSLLEKIIRSDGGDIAELLMRLGEVIDYFQYHQGDIYVIPALLQSQGGDNSEAAKALKKAMVRIKDAMGRLTITEDSKRGLDKAVRESLIEVGKIGSVKEFPGSLRDLPEDPNLTALVESLLNGILNSNGNDISELLIRFGEIQHRLIHNFLDDSPNVAALKKVMAELKETMGRLTIIPSDSAFVDRAMLVFRLGPILGGVNRIFVPGTEPVVQDIKEKLITILDRLIDTDASSLKISAETGDDVKELEGLRSKLIAISDSRAATELNSAINAVLKALGSLSIVEPPADYRISPEGMTRLGGLLSEIEALTADPSELNPDTTPGAAVLIGPRQTLLNLLKNLLAPESSNRSAQNLHEFTYAFTPSGQQEEFRNALAGAVDEIKEILNRSSVLASLGRSTFFGDQEYQLIPSLDLYRRDRAMNAGDAVGGIDLNPANLNLQIKRDGNGVPLPLPMQDIPNINVNGFIPVIINIQPIPNLPQLLGADTTPKDKQPQLSSI